MFYSVECGAKLLYRSHAVGHFYGTEYKILVGFGPVGCTENFGLGHKVHTYATFEGIFYVLMAKKNLNINLE